MLGVFGLWNGFFNIWDSVFNFMMVYLVSWVLYLGIWDGVHCINNYYVLDKF